MPTITQIARAIDNPENKSEKTQWIAELSKQLTTQPIKIDWSELLFPDNGGKKWDNQEYIDPIGIETIKQIIGHYPNKTLSDVDMNVLIRFLMKQNNDESQTFLRELIQENKIMPDQTLQDYLQNLTITSITRYRQEKKLDETMFNAALRKQFNIVEQLINLGVDTNYSPLDDSRTALVFAIEGADNIDLVIKLIQNGADPFRIIDTEKAGRMSIMYFAAYQKKWEIVKAMIKNIALEKLSENQTEINRTIVLAIQDNHTDILDLIIQKKLNCRDVILTQVMKNNFQDPFNITYVIKTFGLEHCLEFALEIQDNMFLEGLLPSIELNGLKQDKLLKILKYAIKEKNDRLIESVLKNLSSDSKNKLGFALILAARLNYIPLIVSLFKAEATFDRSDLNALDNEAEILFSLLKGYSSYHSLNETSNFIKTTLSEFEKKSEENDKISLESELIEAAVNSENWDIAKIIFSRRPENLCKDFIENKKYVVITALLENKIIIFDELRQATRIDNCREIANEIINSYLVKKPEITDDVKDFIRSIVEKFIYQRTFENDAEYIKELGSLREKNQNSKTKNYLEIIGESLQTSSSSQGPSNSDELQELKEEELKTVRQFRLDPFASGTEEKMGSVMKPSDPSSFCMIEKDISEDIIQFTKAAIKEYDLRVLVHDADRKPTLFAQARQKVKPQSETSRNLIKALILILQKKESDPEKCVEIRDALNIFSASQKEKSNLLTILIKHGLLTDDKKPSPIFNHLPPAPAPAP